MTVLLHIRPRGKGTPVGSRRGVVTVMVGPVVRAVVSGVRMEGCGGHGPRFHLKAGRGEGERTGHMAYRVRAPLSSRQALLKVCFSHKVTDQDEATICRWRLRPASQG